jgi:undecaprenyl diphosphate synthase|tara:strand:- start:328 stop:1002 length:675 start_codon:yes stop_codon:yes gene_type:complete
MKKTQKNPNHIAVIMDGNGTWSKRKGLSKKKGHQKGVKSAKNFTSYSLDAGIKNLTLFALSNENLLRSKFELSNLFDIFFYSFAEEKEFLKDNKIRIKFIGNLDKLPKKLKDNALSLEYETKKNKKLNLFVALNYGGKQDIIQAVKKSKNKTSSFENHLFSKDLPEVDLLIRTGGYRRLSNFLLWQTSYAELYFTDVLWPDFRKKNFAKALDWYRSVNRKFGKS